MRIPSGIGHEGPVLALAFSPDSAWLCSGSADRTIRVWDLGHGTISALHPYFDRLDAMGAVAFGGDEGLLASVSGLWGGASLDHGIKLWQTHYDRPIRQLRGHTASVRAIAFASGVNLLASTSTDGAVKLWNSRNGECLRSITNAVPVESLAFTSGAQWLLAGLADGRLCLLATNDLAASRTWLAHARPVQSLAFSPDGRWLATASSDQSVAVWDWPTGRERRRFTNVVSQYLPLAFHPRQPVLVFAQKDELVVHANLETGEVLFQRAMFPDGEWLAWNPDKAFYMASPRGDEHARVRFADQLLPVYPLKLYRGELARPAHLLAALNGPAPTLRPKNLQLWWHRYRYKQAWLIGGLGGCCTLIAAYLWRGWNADRRRRAQETFSRQLLLSQESERKRIAGELHDSLGQNLLVIKNRLYLAQQPGGDDARAEQMQEVTQLVSQTIQEVREISHRLRPYQLDRLGLTKAVQSAAKRVAESGALKIESDVSNVDGLFPPEGEIHFYRIVQESLNNILKHAAAATARLSIQRHGRWLTLRIDDDGRGFDYARATGDPEHPRGLGLTGLSERARILGGRFTCATAPGQGVRLTFEIPIPAKHEKSDHSPGG